MKALAIIDSFKGTLSSKELGQITKETLNNNDLHCDYISIADGGEGFLEAINDDAVKEKIVVNDPLFRLIDCEYLVANEVAYIEMAKSSGLTLLNKDELNPLIATTYGLGEQILDAINKNIKKIIIGIGGSATNDGGCGMLEALGAKFYANERLITTALSFTAEPCVGFSHTPASPRNNPPTIRFTATTIRFAAISW